MKHSGQCLMLVMCRVTSTNLDLVVSVLTHGRPLPLLPPCSLKENHTLILKAKADPALPPLPWFSETTRLQSSGADPALPLSRTRKHLDLLAVKAGTSRLLNAEASRHTARRRNHPRG